MMPGFVISPTPGLSASKADALYRPLGADLDLAPGEDININGTNDIKGPGGATNIRFRLTDTSFYKDILVMYGYAVDCYSANGHLLPRRVSQNDQPTPEEGEVLIWEDADGGPLYYLVYNDPTAGVLKAALT